MRLYIVAILAVFSLSVRADVGDLFANMGTVNSTGPESFKGQTMNHYVGGSFSYRVPQKSYQLMSFSPPRISAGCGGIDLYGGAFSFINEDQLVQLLQNIGNNAVGAIFKLAIDSVSPQLGGVMDYMNDLAQKINALNVNSCQAAEGLVQAGADMVRGKTTDNYVTQFGSRVSGVFDDVTQAKSKISSNINARKDARDAAANSSDPNYSMKMQEVNITWEMLKATRYSSNSSLSESDARLISTLFGAVICTNKANETDPESTESDRICMFHQPSDSDLDEFMVGIATVKAANCRFSGTESQTKCLTGAHFSTTNYTYKVGDSPDFNNFQGYIRGEMDFLRDSIMARGFTAGNNLNDARLKRAFGLVNASRVPAWALIKMSSMDSVGDTFYSQAADSIAADIAYSYIASLHRALRHGIYQERVKGIYVASEDDQKRLEEQLAHADKVLTWFEHYRENANKAFAELGQISATIQAMSATFNNRIAQVTR